MKPKKHPRDYEPDELLLLAMVEAFIQDTDHTIKSRHLFDNTCSHYMIWFYTEQGMDFWAEAYENNLVPTYHTK